jgi:hypothetical protein
MLPETLPNHSFEPITADRLLLDLPRYGHTQAGSLAAVPTRQNLEPAIARNRGLLEYTLEFGWPGKTGFTRK